MKTNTLGSRWELKELPQDSVNRKRISSSGVSNFNESVSGLDPEITFRILSSKLQRVAHNAEAEGLKYRDLKELIEEKYTGDIESLQYTGKVGIQTQGNEIYWGHFDNNLKAVAKRHGQGLIFDENTGLIKIVEYDKGEIKPGSRITELYGDGDIESRIEGAKEFYKYIKATDVSFYGKSNKDANCYVGVSRSKGQLFQGVHKTLSYSPDQGRLVTVTGVEEIGALHGKDLTLNGLASKEFADGTKVEGQWKDGQPIIGESYKITFPGEWSSMEPTWGEEGFDLNNIELKFKGGGQYIGSFRLLNFDPSQRFNIAFANAEFIPISARYVASNTTSFSLQFDNQGFLEGFVDGSPVKAINLINNYYKENTLGQKINLRKFNLEKFINEILKSALKDLCKKVSDGKRYVTREKAAMEDAVKANKSRNKKLIATFGAVIAALSFGIWGENSNDSSKPIQEINVSKQSDNVSSHKQENKETKRFENPKEQVFHDVINSYHNDLLSNQLNVTPVISNILEQMYLKMAESQELKSLFLKSNLSKADFDGVVHLLTLSFLSINEPRSETFEMIFTSLIKVSEKFRTFYSNVIEIVNNLLTDELRMVAKPFKFNFNGKKFAIFQAENTLAAKKEGSASIINYILTPEYLKSIESIIPPEELVSLEFMIKDYINDIKGFRARHLYRKSYDILEFLRNAVVSNKEHAAMISFFNHHMVKAWFEIESDGVEDNPYSFIKIDNKGRSNFDDNGNIVFPIHQIYAMVYKAYSKFGSETAELMYKAATTMSEAASNYELGKELTNIAEVESCYSKTKSFSQEEMVLYREFLKIFASFADNVQVGRTNEQGSKKAINYLLVPESEDKIQDYLRNVGIAEAE